jgi:hypothetical protein
VRYPYHVADPPLRFKEIESERSYEELLEDGFPLDAFAAGDVIATPGVVGDLEAGADVLLAQANFFPGGCLLVVSACHVVSDGIALLTVLRVWAGNCGGRDEEVLSDTFAEDRTLFERLWTQERKDGEADPDPWARDLLGVELAMPAKAQHEKDLSSVVPRTMQSRLFYTSCASMTSLVQACSVGKNGTQALSSNHALSAILWRATSKALVLSAGQARMPSEAVLELLVDGRPDFSQSVPPTFMGNVIFFHHTTLPLTELTAPATSVASVSQAVSAEARKIHRGSLHDAFAHLLAVPDFALVRPRFYGDRDTTVLDISNLMGFPVDDIRFGIEGVGNSGRAEAVRVFVEPVPVGNFIRVILVMPRKTHGGVVFIMQLAEEEMNCLLKDEEFARLCMPVKSMNLNYLMRFRDVPKVSVSPFSTRL